MASINQSAIAAENGAWIEEQERLYHKDPSLLDPSWHALFEQSSDPILSSSAQSEALIDLKVKQLVNAYRTHGHLAAAFDPMQAEVPSTPFLLQCEHYGLASGAFLDATSVDSCELFDAPRVPFGKLLDRLKQLYCGVTGFEYMGLGDPEMERFIQQHIESPRVQVSCSLEEKRGILHQLNRSELFERFLHRHYTGQKRFSLEGGETLIPMLHELIEEAGILGYSEFIVGMAHRGRLNVLANVLEKSYRDIFAEFEENTRLSAIRWQKGFKNNRRGAIQSKN